MELIGRGKYKIGQIVEAHGYRCKIIDIRVKTKRKYNLKWLQYQVIYNVNKGHPSIVQAANKTVKYIDLWVNEDLITPLPPKEKAPEFADLSPWERFKTYVQNSFLWILITGVNKKKTSKGLKEQN